jgi:pimeloyl-ACP methyl ester carboxylesterase
MDDGGDDCWTDVAGIRTRWSVGPGSGRPLVLINGLGANIEMWRPLRRALAGRRTVAFDAPGTGASPTPKTPVGMNQLAHLVSASLDQLGFADVDLLGYSFGGAVAQVVARQDRRRVRRLILAGSTSGWGGFSIHPLAVAGLATPARYYLGHQGDGMSRLAFGDTRQATFYNLDAARSALPPSTLGYWWQLLAIGLWSSHGWLDQISQDTLVIVGDRDRAAPVANSKVLAAGIPHARLEVVAGAGHLMLMTDDVAEVARTIEDFLARRDPIDQSARPLAAR